jgi:glycogen debranching enzyme
MGIDVAQLSRALCDLGGVKKLADLGKRGPLVASAGNESLFNCLFGRDSIRMAMDLSRDFPRVSRATILELAKHQGVRFNARSEEEPGRIIHEHRAEDDPHYAALTKHWDMPYYGAVDSTPQWINLIASHVKLHGASILDEKFVDRSGREITVREAAGRAAEWIVRRMSEHGYVCVKRAQEHGIPNQVWEDSADSYYGADGEPLDPREPYAPVAVQGYAYDALRAAAAICGDSRYEAEASALKARVLRDFWQDDLSTFALALTFGAGGAAIPARTIASSPGHLLASGILEGDELAELRARLVARLFQPDLLDGAGIRTKSTQAARYRAGSYHNGSSWPMDTNVIAAGMRRYGFASQASELEDRILRACAKVGGFPEFFRGDPDGRIRVNVETIDAIVDGAPNRLEQPPQATQGWTVSAVARILSERGLI